jgi:sirohydrochlorin ferrochelatase
MRPARLIPAPGPAVVLVAHGSRDPRAAAATEALARAAGRANPGWEVRAAYLDHAGPRPLQVLEGLTPGRRAVVVPLLLTEAYHGRVDIPAILTEAAGLPVDVRLTEVLGPSRPSPGTTDAPLGALHRRVPALLIDGLVRLLGDVRGLDAVVLAAAGTRDAIARETITWAADALSARLGLRGGVAYASGAPPTAGEAVARLRAEGARRVGVAAYFLAPGFLHDLAMTSAREAGAVSTADPLGDADELVRLIEARVAAAGESPLATAA